jgi:signal transduction histidine kinase/ligand-binding sensor domain-containing protein/CheY-like chemotaxis protein/HPt (histidine-containing phosphotransfer) domain-containing protein
VRPGLARRARGARLALILALGLGLAAAAPPREAMAQPRFHHVSVEDGLPHSSVLSITIDTRGFLWIATYDGLVRHDGYEYRAYQAESGNPDAISDGNIRAVLPDHDGSLWVGAKSGGLNYFDARHDRFLHYRHDPGDPHSLPHDEVRALCRDPSGLLWVGTFGGLAAFDPVGKTFTTYRQSGAPGVPRATDEILSLVPGPGGVIFVGAQAGLFRFDTAAKTFTPIPLWQAGPASDPGTPAAAGPPITSLTMQAGGVLWVGTEWQGLYEIDLEGGGVRRHLPDRAVASSFRDSRGGIWVGTDAGLAYRAKPGDPFVMYVHDPLDPMSLCGNDIRGIAEDASGILWFGSFTAGLSKLSPKTRAFDLYRKKNDDPRGLSGSEVSAVTMDAAGRLWVGLRDGGITVLDRKAKRRQVFQHDPSDPGSLSQNEVTSLLRDRSGRVWAGTADCGLNLFDEAAGVWRHFRHDPGDPESLSQDKIWFVTETRDGMLWIGTSKGGLNRFDPATGKCRRYQNEPGNPKSISHDRVRHITESADGALWIGTNKGLNRLDRATETFEHWQNVPGDPKSLSNDRVTPIVEIPGGQLWVGTDNGLNRFDPKTGTFTRYTKADGLLNDGIQSILRDETGILWMSTFKGLSRFDPAAGEFRNYTAKDGLQGVEFWMNADYRDPYSGEMFFGGVKGLNGFFPGEVEKNPHIPPVVITSISIADRGYAGDVAADFTAGIELSPPDQGFTVSYAALDFADPSKNQYASMLEGFDREFSKPSSRRFVTYTNLDPGDYVLRLRASNDDGIWNDVGASLRVRVLPPYWRTFWFRLSMLAATVGAGWLFYRLRLSRVERKRVELASMVDERTLALRREIEERKAAEERLREAKFTAEQAASAKSEFLARMSHEIRTPINIIMGMADLLSESGLTDRQRRYVGSFQSAGELLLSIINDILDFSKIEAGRIELEHTAFSLREELRRVADLAAFRASGKGLGFSWSVDDDVPDFVLGDPARLRQVLMNLLGNALKFTVSGEVRLHAEHGGDISRNEPPAPGEAFVVRFTIADTGIGIPQKVLGDIFDRFTQADVSTSRQYGGTGLGLAICRKLVDLMGGTISVTSEEGRGSEFSFTAMFEAAGAGSIPPPASTRLQDDSFPAGEAVSVDPPSARPLTFTRRAAILLAEDNEANRNVVRLFLADLPVEIVVAENGLRAVELAGTRVFDLMFMDVEMPGMDGLAATRAIREMEQRDARPPVPIIALTAHAFQEHRQQCLEAGCTDFVTKPVGKTRLIQVLDVYLPGRGFAQAAGASRSLRDTAVADSEEQPQEAPASETGQRGGYVVYIKERLKPIVPVFTRTAGQGLSEMRQRLSAGDLEGVRRGGHSLKGSAATMGFAALEIMGRDIEKAAHEGDDKAVAALLDELGVYLDGFEVRYR